MKTSKMIAIVGFVVMLIGFGISMYHMAPMFDAFVAQDMTAITTNVLVSSTTGALIGMMLACYATIATTTLLLVLEFAAHLRKQYDEGHSPMSVPGVIIYVGLTIAMIGLVMSMRDTLPMIQMIQSPPAVEDIVSSFASASSGLRLGFFATIISAILALAWEYGSRLCMSPAE